MKICERCVMPDTRPRLLFNANGVCAACEWHKLKMNGSVSWEERKKEFEILCDSVRGKNRYDCIVPVSGGKDSTYVADKLKNTYGLNVLTITVTPPLETHLIQDNLNSFLSHGFDNIKVTPNPQVMQKICKYGFIEQGRPLLGWTACLNSVMFRMATEYNIPLVMFGEEGETEYGGTKELRNVPCYDMDFAIRVYTYGNDVTDMKCLSDNTTNELLWWMYPSEKEMRKVDFKVLHWSYYENWDPYKHYVLARDAYGMKVPDNRNRGTYSNFAQLDTPLYSLHTYLMYLKFGFGRCLQDACIDIRHGRLSREKAVDLVRQYDGEFPSNELNMYLDYFGMTRQEFDDTLNKHANKELFRKDGSKWVPQFVIE